MSSKKAVINSITILIKEYREGRIKSIRGKLFRRIRKETGKPTITIKQKIPRIRNGREGKSPNPIIYAASCEFMLVSFVTIA